MIIFGKILGRFWEDFSILVKFWGHNFLVLGFKFGEVFDGLGGLEFFLAEDKCCGVDMGLVLASL